MKHYRVLTHAGGSVIAALAPTAALAASNPFTQAKTDLSNIQGASGISTTDLPTLVGRIINAVLGVLGLVLLIYLIYGGFKWMTSGGETKGVEESKRMITHAIVGLVIIMAAVAISNFVISALVNVAS